ncbi:MAG: type II toxin-antitoxin system RelE family toxin [Candidatus Binatia bacterium]
MEKEFLKQLEQLGPEEQRRVLDFVRALATCKKPGTPGGSLIRFGGAIDEADLATMSEGIAGGCEQIEDRGHQNG